MAAGLRTGNPPGLTFAPLNNLTLALYAKRAMGGRGGKKVRKAMRAAIKMRDPRAFQKNVGFGGRLQNMARYQLGAGAQDFLVSMGWVDKGKSMLRFQMAESRPFTLPERAAMHRVLGRYYSLPGSKSKPQRSAVTPWAPVVTRESLDVVLKSMTKVLGNKIRKVSKTTFF
jgi:hypothetical protein